MGSSIVWKLTGGRPMRREESLFVDRVSGKLVSGYVDKLGRRWLADNGPWSLFRVERDGK